MTFTPTGREVREAIDFSCGAMFVRNLLSVTLGNIRGGSKS